MDVRWTRRAGRSVLVLLLVLPACAERSSRAGPRSAVVTEKDFAITAPATLPAGAVTLRVVNEGPIQHELIIVRAAAGLLPLRRSGITADEEALVPLTVATLEPGPPGEVRELRVQLGPGSYQLFCNMDGHYLAGMHTSLVVE